MLEIIFYYTGGILLITLSLLFSLIILKISYELLHIVSKNFRYYFIISYKFSKMTKNEKNLLDDIYDSIKGEKEKVDKYFKN